MKAPSSKAQYSILFGKRPTRILFNSLSFLYTYHLCGPGGAVGIATGYGLDGPGIEFRWGRDFPHLSRPALGPTQPPE